MIGRELELEMLSGVLDGLPDRGGALVLRGEPGIGKSVLLDAPRGTSNEHSIRVLYICEVMNRQWDTGRTEAFSDGVLGVAITLLVLDINIPQSQVKHFWYSIVHLWPTYLAYLTSFATIGGLWLAHHGIFARLSTWTAR